MENCLYFDCKFIEKRIDKKDREFLVLDILGNRVSVYHFDDRDYSSDSVYKVKVSAKDFNNNGNHLAYLSYTILP